MPERLPARIFPSPSEKHKGVAVRAGKESFRVMSASTVPGTPERSRVIQVAFDRSEEDKLLAEFRGRILPLLAVSLLLSVAVGYEIAAQVTAAGGAVASGAGRATTPAPTRAAAVRLRWLKPVVCPPGKSFSNI